MPPDGGRKESHTMSIYFLIALAILLLVLVIGSLTAAASPTNLAHVWITALRNVIITIVAALAVLAALPILEAVVQ